MQMVGSGGLFLYTAVIHVLLLGYIAFRFFKREPVHEEEHRKFVDALAGTQTASHVYEDEIAEQEQASS